MSGSGQTTMKDVAKAAGVSVMTVSRALKKNSSISDVKRKQILSLIQEMNYVPDQMAGSLSSKKSGFVAALLPSINNLHFAQTVQSLTKQLENSGLQLLLGYTDYSAEKEEKIVELMLRRRPEAIVLTYDGHTQRTRDLLENASIPVVEIWEQPKDPIQHSVGFSNFDAAKKMTNTLIDKGYKKIAFLGEADDFGTRGAARRNGFISAMEDHGLSAERIVQFEAPPVTIGNGAIAAKSLLEKFPDVDCVFCVSDFAAFGVQSHFIKVGVNIPNDIAVVGFGDFEVSRYALPSISTVKVDPILIGHQTGQLICNILGYTGKKPEQFQHLDIHVEISLRESVKD